MEKYGLRRRVSKILLKCANIIFLVLFSYIFLRVIWHTQDIIGGEKSRYVISWLIWGILGIVCVAFCRISIPKNYRIGLIIILLLIQYIYVWAIYSQVDSDAYVITYIGYNLAKGNLIDLEGFWKQYLAVYTNNIPATAIITAIFRIWLPDSLEQSWYMLSVIAAILSDITLVFIYKLVKMTLGRKYALVAMMLSIALITMSEPGTILYTDIMALWTTPAALYSLMLCRKKQIHYIVLASLTLAIGAWIKPQSWVITIAIGITLLLEWLHAIEENQRRLLRKRMALFISAFGVISLGLSMITYSAINLMGKEYVEENKMPMLYFVAMGLNPQTNGVYSEEDVIDSKSQIGQEAKKKLNREKIADRLNELGGKGFIKHIDKKLIYGAGNGTFTTGREWRGVLLNNSLQAKRIQNWTIVQEKNFERNTTVWIQCGYLLTFFMSIYSSVYGLLRKRKEQNADEWFLANICRIAMIGTVLMLILLERNLRYMYATLPCMIFLTSYSCNKIMEKAVKLNNNE